MLLTMTIDNVPLIIIEKNKILWKKYRRKNEKVKKY